MSTSQDVELNCSGLTDAPLTQPPHSPTYNSDGSGRKHVKKDLSSDDAEKPKPMPRTSSRLFSTKEILSEHNSKLDLLVEKEEEEEMHRDLERYGEIHIAGYHWTRWLFFSIFVAALVALVLVFVVLDSRSDDKKTVTYENTFETVLIVPDNNVVLESNSISVNGEWRVDDGNNGTESGGDFFVRLNLTNHYSNPKVLYLEETPLMSLLASPPAHILTDWFGHNSLIDYEGIIAENEPGSGQSVTVQAGETISAEINLGPSMIFLADSGTVEFDLQFSVPFRGVQGSVIEVAEQTTNAVDLLVSQVGRRRNVRRTARRRHMTAGAGSVALTDSSDTYAGVPYWDCGGVSGCYNTRWTKPWNAKSYTISDDCSVSQKAEVDAAETLKDNFCANMLYCMEKKTAACNTFVNKWFGCSGDTCTDDSQWDTLRTGWVRICSATNYYYECAASENVCQITFSSDSSCSTDADCGEVDGVSQAITGGTCTSGKCEYANSKQNHIPASIRDAFITQCESPWGCGYSATVAWVWSGEPCNGCTRRMNLCRIGFWVQKDYQDSSWRSKASVIIHELAHFRDIQDTDDMTYSTSTQLDKAAEAAASASTSDDWFYLANSANWDNLSDDYVPDGGTPQAWNSFDEGGGTPDPCTAPTIDSSAATWSGSGCFNGASVPDSTTCNLVAKYGYTCTSPGLCMDGSWAQTGSCVANTCPLIDVTESGETAGANCLSEPAYNQPTCTFQCQTGYSISGSNTIACDSNGVWPSHPTCTLSPTPTPTPNPCIAPSITGGSWSGSGCANGASVEHGTTCVLTPFTGFTCTSPGLCDEGTWDQTGSCVENTCDAISRTASGTTSGANCPSRGASTPSSCTFFCETDYAINGVNPVSCNVDGTWDPYPSCQPSASDTNPCTLPTIGSTAATWSGSSECADAAEVSHGESCTLLANHGYSCTSPGECTNGAFAAAASCQENTCIAIHVNASGTTAGANCNGGGASGSPTCTFSCEDGYKIAEDSVNPIECSSDGMWPSDRPRCVNASSVEDDDVDSQILGVDSNTFIIMALVVGVVVAIILCCCVSYCCCWGESKSDKNHIPDAYAIEREPRQQRPLSWRQSMADILPPKHGGIKPYKKIPRSAPKRPPSWKKKRNAPPGIPGTIRPKCTVRANHRYKAAALDELGLKKGSILRVLVVHDDGWCYGMDMKSRKKGMFPMNFVKAVN